MKKLTNNILECYVEDEGVLYSCSLCRLEYPKCMRKQKDCVNPSTIHITIMDIMSIHFTSHIKEHLIDDEVVMCKICHKTVEEIWEERIDE